MKLEKSGNAKKSWGGVRGGVGATMRIVVEKKGESTEGL